MIKGGRIASRVNDNQKSGNRPETLPSGTAQKEKRDGGKLFRGK